MTEKGKDLPPEAAGVPGDEGTEACGPGGPAADTEGQDELSAVKTRLAYLAAEFDNYRKRVTREKESIVSYGNERLLLAILPFLDNLERALSQGGGAGSAEPLLAGVRITYDQILQELRKFGVEQIAALGERFDPALHDAISQIAWEGKPEGTVLSEARKGYLLNGRLLRPAQVVVAKGAGAEGAADDGEGNGGVSRSPEN